MAERDDWMMGALADPVRGAYPRWAESPAEPDAIIPPPRNPARDIPEAFFPNLSRSETYGPQPPPTMVLNEQGKVPTSDPRVMGVLADTGNALQYAIPTGGPVAGGAKAAAAIGGFMARRLPGLLERTAPKMGELFEPIRAYHSSPHDFERFDASKIGTGEGAQMYGHGIYFAENPAVSGQGGQYWQQFADRFRGTPEGDAAEYLRRAGFDRDAAVAMVNKDIADVRANPAWHGPGTEAGIKQLEQHAKLLESGKPVGPRTYEVAIHARPEQFLDWDKPLSQQPALAQGPLKGFDINPEMTGQEVRNIMFRKARDDAKAAGSRLEGSQHSRAASEALLEAGVPGIRYLDQGSRVIPGQVSINRKIMSDPNVSSAMREQAKADLAKWEAEKPTSNYVVFDPSKIDILRKYGLAGAVPTMGALAATDQYRQ